MASFYTRKGDDGYTVLVGKGRHPKHNIHLEALGAIDESNAVLGIARSQCLAKELPNLILHIQHDLYKLMGEIAVTGETAGKLRAITGDHILWLEDQTDQLVKTTPIPEAFIVPGDCPSAAYLDHARTVIRRAERRLAALLHSGEIGNPEVLRYLNRLSSMCFAMEIREIQASGRQLPTLARDVE
jgi:cob(I)alamin adenosyltransferase